MFISKVDNLTVRDKFYFLKGDGGSLQPVLCTVTKQGKYLEKGRKPGNEREFTSIHEQVLVLGSSDSPIIGYLVGLARGFEMGRKAG